ncbi:MAG TPA: tRNA adenosine(34) deaminase TadA [Firmicutes bacterium]|jgi:tRNA(adenine34) deaminase|nr:tRNA adenosine(34) deaminase TadA [Bacillota bacterium]HBE06391.1 tRNA adenosine(34) deaminase TadA [Bacillota bacterium]HBG43827.1 tRNA adenosine(34) deaminase TadA [Bacillota bacterium]HBL48873.1 tRNA adenosine(34) deaminase TadA [Bacillota bacterium]HBL69267.1 tRNA adenosine(34) deaminase TadA [Bacillota bacterium]
MTDDFFMRAALAEAQKAYQAGEVPIGAVIVRDGAIYATGHNLRETGHDPTAHAEIVAIRNAATRLGHWRLSGMTLYVTIEPCPMCAGALVNARIARLVFGAADPKAGAVISLMDLVRDKRLNHRMEVTAGVLTEECADLMCHFFRMRRGEQA